MQPMRILFYLLATVIGLALLIVLIPLIILILLTMTLPLAGKILRQVRIIAGKEASSHL